MKLASLRHKVPLQSDRYVLGTEIGRGNWGIVYDAQDTLTGDEVAIKVFSPTDTALLQADYRNLELEEIVKKERLSLGPSTRLVPRFVMQDANGRPFLVMKKWPTWLSDVMARRESGEESPSTFDASPMLPTRFSTNEVIHFANEIGLAVRELHERHGRAHCDIKPDNLALDKGTIMISDFGTSTYSLANTPHRDNMGHLYTRSLHLFVPGQHPHASDDVFAAASLIFKLYTGKYPFEDEINALVGTPGGLESFARKYHPGQNGIRVTNTSELVNVLKEKLADPHIPEPYKSPLMWALEGRYSSDAFVTRLRDAQQEYQQSLKSKSERRNLLEEIKDGIKWGAGGGVMFGTAGLIFAWMMYFDGPNFKNRPDFETRASIRNAEQSEIFFELEQRYNQPIKEVGRSGFTGMISKFEEDWDPKILMDRITMTWLHTINEMKSAGNEGEFENRYHSVFNNGWRLGHTVKNKNGERRLAGMQECYRDYFQHAFKANSVDGHVIDIEDATMQTMVGLEVLNRAQKITDSKQYSVYKHARYNGELLIPLAHQLVAERFWTNLANRMSGMVRYRSDTSKK